MNKKIVAYIVIVVLIIAVVVAAFFLTNKKSDSKDILTQDGEEMALSDIMDKLYENMDKKTLPSNLENIEVTDENIEYYLGTSEVEYEECLASEPIFGSIAHSVVLVRLKDGVNADEAVEKIKTNVNPSKWVCVFVQEENVKVVRRGRTVLLVMTDTNPDQYVENFNNI